MIPNSSHSRRSFPGWSWCLSFPGIVAGIALMLGSCGSSAVRPGRPMIPDDATLDDLRRWCLTWQQEVRASEDETVKRSDTLKAVYEVFRAVFRPTTPLPSSYRSQFDLGDFSAVLENRGSRFVVVQDRIRFTVQGREELARPDHVLGGVSTVGYDSIEGFRPKLTVPNAEVLYFTKARAGELTRFLMQDSAAYENGDTSVLAQHIHRYELVRQLIPVIPGHWGGYWHIETHPLVQAVSLDASLSRAVVAVRIGYGGKDVMLSRDGDGWRIESVEFTWRE
jgi:hypothetical protein